MYIGNEAQYVGRAKPGLYNVHLGTRRQLKVMLELSKTFSYCNLSNHRLLKCRVAYVICTRLYRFMLIRKPIDLSVQNLKHTYVQKNENNNAVSSKALNQFKK